jgi:trimethylamine--corrinoid protein Co-methyltransferase
MIANSVSLEQMKTIHEAALHVLSKTGMRINCDEFYGPLESRGAKIDRSCNVVRFPPKLIEEIIEQIRKEIANGYVQNILNGVVSGRSSRPFQAKVGGACIEFLDWETKTLRRPTRQDLINSLRLGEALPDVGSVGNPVVCLFDDNGKAVTPKMQRIITAATVAKYTTKCGSTEVWNEKELDLLMEIGIIVKGSKAAFLQNPCFVTAKETIAPLLFPEEDGRILLMLARNGLPCTIVPMPMTGMSSPATIASNVVMTIAEVLGAMTALKVTVPEARVAGGVISSTIDMRSMVARFATPEAINQDMLAARIFDKLYGQNFGVGSGYIDARVPGPQALFEKYARMTAAIETIGSYCPSVGIMAGGKRHCPEEVILEVELGRHISQCFAALEVSEDTLCLDLIDEVGISGNFIGEEHTAMNFRELFQSDLIAAREDDNLEAELKRDMVDLAIEKKKKILAEAGYEIDADKAKAIDEVVKKAERIL